MNMSECCCAYTACPKGASVEDLKACSICHSVSYCSRECQRSSWVKEGHKYACVKSDVPRHHVQGTLYDLQAAIDGANEGDVITLVEGEYKWSGPSGHALQYPNQSIYMGQLKETSPYSVMLQSTRKFPTEVQ